jgi:ethylmalonyl-CoA/methylmalonyl-CoA decarboxylase
LNAKHYSTSQPTAELFSPHDSLPEIRTKLRGLGQGTIDFVPDYQPGVGLITLNNPTRHNAMSGVMMSQLADLTDKLESEPTDLAGLIVTGAMPAKAFCAGLGKKQKNSRG